MAFTNTQTNTAYNRFCDYSVPQAALRALRILKDLDLDEKKLLINVNKQTQKILDEYEERIKQQKQTAPIDAGITLITLITLIT